MDRWNGTAWSQVAVPRIGSEPMDYPPGSTGTTGAALGAVACVSVSECVAVGVGTQTLGWNGSSWAASPAPATVGGGALDVSCTSTGVCFAAADTSVMSGQPQSQMWIGGLSGANWDPGLQVVAPPKGGGIGYDANSPSEASSGGSSAGSSGSGACGCAQAVVADPVDTANGGFYLTTSVLSVPGGGVPLALSVSYNSVGGQGDLARGALSEGLGAGWYTNLGMHVAVASGAVTLTEENGAQIGFAPYVPGSSPAWCTGTEDYCPDSPRILAALNHNADGTWTFVREVGGQTTFTFSSSGVLSSVADSAGATIAESAGTPGVGGCPASAASCVVWAPTDAAARSITLAYDSSGALVSAVDEAGHTVTFCEYGQSCATSSGGKASELASLTNLSGATTTYTYDAGNANADLVADMLTETTAPAAPLQNTYDPSGRVERQTSPAGELTTYSYSGDNVSSAGGTTTVTSYPDGTSGLSVVDVYAYAYGMLQGEEIGSTASTPVTAMFERSPASATVTSVENGDGDVSASTLASFDASGGTPVSSADVTSQTNAAGDVTLQQYTATNQVWCIVGPAEAAAGVTCPSSEPQSPPAVGSDPWPGATVAVYDTAGQEVSTTDPLGRTTLYGYTTAAQGVPAGLRYCTVDPANYAKAVVCPAYGATAPGAQTETFDSAGDVLMSTNADGNTTANTYSTSHPGLVKTTTDPEGTVTTYAYNAAGQVTAQTTSFGGYSATTQTAYTPAGGSVPVGLVYCTVSPQNYANDTRCPASPPPMSSPTAGATNDFYDATGRLIETVSPIGGETSYAYDDHGNRYCTVAPFEAAQGVTCPSLPLTAPTVGSDDYPGATIDIYNLAGQLVQETNPLGGITTYGYDAAGHKTSQTVSGDGGSGDPAVTTDYRYDQAGNVTSTTVDPGGQAQQTTKSAYDPDGNVYCSMTAKETASASTDSYQCPPWQAGWIGKPPSPSSLYSSTPDSSQANGVEIDRVPVG